MTPDEIISLVNQITFGNIDDEKLTKLYEALKQKSNAACRELWLRAKNRSDSRIDDSCVTD